MATIAGIQWAKYSTLLHKFVLGSILISLILLTWDTLNYNHISDCDSHIMGYYNREQLLALNTGTHSRLPSDVWDNIKSLGIQKTTHRGKRAGTRKQKHPIQNPKKPNQTSTNQTSINAVLWNAQSVRHKTISIYDYAVEHDVDIFFFTETWLCETDAVIIGELTPPGYDFMHVPRMGTELYGGTGILFKSALKLQIKPSTFKSKTFEHAVILDCTRCIQYVLVYRPPPSTGNKFKISDFLSEIEDFITECSMTPNRLLILGDFNLHLDIPEKWDVRFFLTSLSALNLEQHVTEPTHKSEHILDLLISRANDNFVSNCKVYRLRLKSDHFVVHFHINHTKPKLPKIVLNVRNYKSMNDESFKNDLKEELEHCIDFVIDDINDVYDNFEMSLISVLDKHAPLTERSKRVRSVAPWYNHGIHQARQTRRRFERQWRKHPTEENRLIFVKQHTVVNKMIRSAKSTYFKSELDSANNKEMYQVLRKLLNSGAKILPTHSSAKELSNLFADFFEKKIEIIRNDLDKIDSNEGNATDCQGNRSFIKACGSGKLYQFTPVTEEQIGKIISNLPNKSATTDALPTWLLKKCADIVVPAITKIVNLSFRSGSFPTALKTAVVTPIIKKPSLDSNQLKNYRPVSNIKTFSKIIEKSVVKQLDAHLTTNDLHDPYQSAYRPRHGTETTLLKVKSDMLAAMDDQKATCLVLLDLSSAFDTIDHSIMIQRLSEIFNVSGAALDWTSSYLQGRTSRVLISGQASDKHTMHFGVPQGSVMGPGLFTKYTYPVGQIIQQNGLHYQIYADDTQIYTCFNPRVPGDTVVALFKVQRCIEQIKKWMDINKLKLNEQKTELFIAGSKNTLTYLENISLDICGCKIIPSKCVRNLGVYFDSNLTMSEHVTSICRSLN